MQFAPNHFLIPSGKYNFIHCLLYIVLLAARTIKTETQRANKKLTTRLTMTLKQKKQLRRRSQKSLCFGTINCTLNVQNNNLTCIYVGLTKLNSVYVGLCNLDSSTTVVNFFESKNGVSRNLISLH